MKLHEFLDQNRAEILKELVAFAQTLDPGGEMSLVQLRDHAEAIVQAIALDIDSAQNERQRYEKSRGHSDGEDIVESAAAIHGAMRQASNFTLLQLSAEFRALRATVLRLWLPRMDKLSPESAEEMVRFNEAIDQALAESIVTYSARASQMRELFLAILGHDLRAPLSTMALSGEMLKLAPTDPAQIQKIGTRVRRSARLMSTMVDDLIGYTRLQLGSGMPMDKATIDLGDLCAAAVEDAGAARTSARFEVATEGDLAGLFDKVRLHQLLTNLLVNAAQYGGTSTPVRLTAEGDPECVTLRVTNRGPVIPEDSWESIFQPLVQLDTGDGASRRQKTSLGLGLYVARQIALLHGGTIDVRSTPADGTTFTVRLPRA